MFQDFSRTRLGAIRVSTEGLEALVSRYLPQGAYCSAVRLRPHDGLCLVMICDSREFWSREDDMRRARAMTTDLKTLGVKIPRVQWVRQGLSRSDTPLSAHPVLGSPFFWTLMALALGGAVVLPWKSWLILAALGLGSWRLAAWSLSEGGRRSLHDLLPILRRGFRR